jgi:hypothetical protein
VVVTQRDTGRVTPREVTLGSVARAVDAVVAELGTLHGAQVVLAASALRLARALDRRADENLARELRITVTQLVGHSAAGLSVDRVSELRDEIARKREQRKQASL